MNHPNLASLANGQGIFGNRRLDVQIRFAF
jgi:hypothetical protein